MALIDVVGNFRYVWTILSVPGTQWLQLVSSNPNRTAIYFVPDNTHSLTVNLPAASPLIQQAFSPGGTNNAASTFPTGMTFKDWGPIVTLDWWGYFIAAGGVGILEEIQLRDPCDRRMASVERSPIIPQRQSLFQSLADLVAQLGRPIQQESEV